MKKKIVLLLTFLCFIVFLWVTYQKINQDNEWRKFVETSIETLQQEVMTLKRKVNE